MPAQIGLFASQSVVRVVGIAGIYRRLVRPYFIELM